MLKLRLKGRPVVNAEAKDGSKGDGQISRRESLKRMGALALLSAGAGHLVLRPQGIEASPSDLQTINDDLRVTGNLLVDGVVSVGSTPPGPKLYVESADPNNYVIQARTTLTSGTRRLLNCYTSNEGSVLTVTTVETAVDLGDLRIVAGNLRVAGYLRDCRVADGEAINFKDGNWYIRHDPNDPSYLKLCTYGGFKFYKAQEASLLAQLDDDGSLKIGSNQVKAIDGAGVAISCYYAS